MCQQFQQYETTNVYAVPYGYDEQKWVADPEYDLVALMDVDLVEANAPIRQPTVKLGRKYLFTSNFQLNPQNSMFFPQKIILPFEFLQVSNELFQFLFQK